MVHIGWRCHYTLIKRGLALVKVELLGLLLGLIVILLIAIIHQ